MRTKDITAAIYCKSVSGTELVHVFAPCALQRHTEVDGKMVWVDVPDGVLTAGSDVPREYRQTAKEYRVVMAGKVKLTEPADLGIAPDVPGAKEVFGLYDDAAIIAAQAGLRNGVKNDPTKAPRASEQYRKIAELVETQKLKPKDIALLEEVAPKAIARLRQEGRIDK